MRRISSQLTFCYKRVAPTLMYGILALDVALPIATPLLSSKPAELPPLSFFLIPIFIGVGFYVLMKMFVFDLVDEVLDDGSALIIKNGGRNDRITLSDIESVSGSIFTNPTRVTLLLRKPSAFGSKVTFTPV